MGRGASWERIGDVAIVIQQQEMFPALLVQLMNGQTMFPQMSEESGLGSGSASMSSSVLTMEGHTGYDDSIWEKALTDPRSNHYTWEWIG